MPLTLGQQNALLAAATAAADGRCQCQRKSCLYRHGADRCDSTYFIEHASADPDLSLQEAMHSGAALLVLCRYCASERIKAIARRRTRQSPGQRPLFAYTALDPNRTAEPDTPDPDP